MTATADLREQLQAAWQSAAPPVTTALATVPSCGAHLDPSNWHREPLPERPGWERATCRRCGQPMGDNAIDRKK